MGIQFVGMRPNNVDTVSLTNLLYGSESAPLKGDLVIAFGHDSATVNHAFSTNASGWTKLHEDYYNYSYDVNLGVFYKTMDDTPDTSIQLLPAGYLKTHAWVFRNARVNGYVKTSGSGNYPNPGIVTPTVPGSIILVIAGVASNISNPQIGAYPSGTTKKYGMAYYYDGWSAACTYENWISGSVDLGAWSGGSNEATGTWSCICVLLEPTDTVNSGMFFGSNF